MGNAIAADKSYCSRGAKSIVAQNSLLIERSQCGRGPGVCVVVHHLVAQCCNRKAVTGRAHVGSNSIAIHFFDGGRQVRIVAVRIVVSRARKGGGGYNRGIHVLGLPRHEWDFVAELSVLRSEERRVGKEWRSGL